MGRLDARNPSLWIGTTPATDYPPLDGELDVDVAVVGGGITGLTTAYLLQRDGASVAVLEAGHVAAGTTGFTTAKMTSLHTLTYADLIARHGEDKARQYGAANEAAIARAEAIVDELGVDCDWQRRAAYTYTTDPAQVPRIEAEVDAATRLGLPASLVTETPLPYPVAAAVRFDDQAQLHPRRYALALADAVTAAGGRVLEQTRAVAVHEGGERVRVDTERGPVTAGAVVVATLLPFTDLGGFFAKAHPSRSYALAVAIDGEAPDGMFISVDQPTRSVRPATVDGGPGLVVAGGGHKTGHGDPQQEYADLERWTRSTFPVRDVAYRWSAQDYVPVDGVPYVGRSPRRHRTYVATGFKKWGLSNGTAAAMILAEQLANRDSPWGPAFDATRVEVSAATAKTFVGENLEVGKQLVSGYAERLRLPAASSLAPGQGAVVDAGGRDVAAYRDNDGRLHAVSPVCTHMGCTVTFNAAETTWDCPCHGSRFAVDGQPLEGPAARPLDAVVVDEDGPPGS
ncbi:MAG: FAD-dependent oxidoreductase [Actinomycetota bacterium]|nr:FAD-dependent oxidoreductase [Actinomycetota bacterium]